MKNLKMAQKLGLGFGIITLLVCVLGYLAYSALSDGENTIHKISDAYMPASDAASGLLDDLRIAQRAMYQFDTFGKKKDIEEAQKYIERMPKEFAILKDLSSANADLTTLASSVRDYPPLYKAYTEGVASTAKTIALAEEKFKSILTSAATLEGILNELEEHIFEAGMKFQQESNAAALGNNTLNLHLVGVANLQFKEIRRVYANARLTYDVSVLKTIHELGEKAKNALTDLEKNLTLQQNREQCVAAQKALQAYKDNMNVLFQAWEELDKAIAARRDASAIMVTLLETLNAAANKNAKSYGDAAVKKSEASVKLITMATGIMALLAIVLSLVLTKLITGPLGMSMRFAQSVAAGNLDDHLDVQSRDEIGKLADALRAMVDTLKGKIAESDAKAEEARRMGEEAKTAMEVAKKAQAAAESAKREGMLAAAGQLEGIVEIVSSASTELSAQVEESERGASITSERITETATAMEEMNATVLEVARSAGGAASVSNDAKLKAEDGAKIVDNVVRCIADVEQQSTQLKTDMIQLGQQAEAIGTIMNVISDIADQTNLLALNAAIEAARAGEAGRGFAVVADEVRKLAEKTMQATVEVGNAIKGVQQSADKNMKSVDISAQSIGQATDLVRQAGNSLKEIVGLVESSADQVRTIATAAEEQSATSEEINRALGTVSNASSETARAMAEASQAVSDLAQQAQQLTRIIGEMKRA